MSIDSKSDTVVALGSSEAAVVEIDSNLAGIAFSVDEEINVVGGGAVCSDDATSFSDFPIVTKLLADSVAMD